MIGFNIPQNFNMSKMTDNERQLWNYVLCMQEQLEYYLRNLDKENFNETGLSEITSPIVKQISDVEGNVTEIAATAEGLTTRVSSAEGNIVTAQQTATSASVTASNAYGEAQSVKLTVKGFTVDGPSGETTIDGSKIKSGTIEGVTLISSDGTSTEVQIVDGEFRVQIPDSYIHLLRVGMIDGYIMMFAPYQGYPLKIFSAGNMAIDSKGGTIFIGTSAGQSGNVTIGQAGGEVRLIGNNITVNGNPIGTAVFT